VSPGYPYSFTSPRFACQREIRASAKPGPHSFGIRSNRGKRIDPPYSFGGKRVDPRHRPKTLNAPADDTPKAPNDGIAPELCAPVRRNAT
jgi:hypothetical protein